MNFTQGRSKNYAITSYIVTKKCKGEIKELIRSFKTSTDLILQDFEIFQRYIYEKKVRPLESSLTGDFEHDETYRTLLKLSQDEKFYQEVVEESRSKK